VKHRRPASATILRSVVLLVFLLAGVGILLTVLPEASPAIEEELAVAVYDSSETDWDDYLWPTDASTRRTSDFAEFRRTHLHAGIDVSTGGRIGFKVFAVRDGWLHSILFDPGGYGWFVVLRHHDGYYSCYAHLDRPADTLLHAWYDALRGEGRSYGEVVWEKGVVPVSKGDVIAYTGNTGAGPPHLHFEIRDADYNPVNPGLSRNLRPVDSLPPEIRGLMLVPLDAASSIDGQWEAKQYTPAGATSAWTVRGLPVLRGRVGILLRAHDRANDATDYPTPYRLRLLVDGKECFSSTAMRFADSLAWHIRIDRDHELMQSRKGEFRKLYREEGSLLEFYFPHTRDAGVLDARILGSGRKALTIIAEDLAGNTSTLLMNVALAHDIPLRMEANETHLSMSVEDRTVCRRVLLLDNTGTPARTLHSWSPAEAAKGISLDLRPYQGRTLRIVAEDSSGYEQVRSIFVPGSGSRAAGRLYQRRVIQYDEIIYDLRLSSPFSAPPQMRMVVGEQEVQGRVFPVDASRYRAVIRARDGMRGKARIELRYAVASREIVWTDSLEFQHISARRGGQIRSNDGFFVLNFAPGDVYRSMICQLDESGSGDGRRFAVTPSHIPLAGRPMASFRIREEMRGVYMSVQAPMRKYNERRDAVTLSARIGRFLGAYAAAIDTVGPVISVDIARRSREPVRIVVRDTLSGVDFSSIVVRIDGSIVPLHYDERRAQLYVPAPVFRQYEGKEVSVLARDRVGNESTVTRKLR
jgi:hypothetical protein